MGALPTALAAAFICTPRTALAVENSPVVADQTATPQLELAPSLPAPAGPLVAGGLTLAPGEGGAIGFRLDLGTALSSSERSELRALVATSYNHVSEGGAEAHGLAPLLTVQYARTVLMRPNGRIAVIGEAGAGPVFAWFKTPDLPYMPPTWESEIRPGGRLAGAVEYRSTRGWFALLQPAGVLFALVDEELEGSFELGLRVGYQWP